VHIVRRAKYHKSKFLIDLSIINLSRISLSFTLSAIFFTLSESNNPPLGDSSHYPHQN